MIGRGLRVGLLLLLALGTAEGQTLRSVVVPADAPLAVPPRGQYLPPAPRASHSPPPWPPQGLPVLQPLPGSTFMAGPMGLAGGAGLLVPLAAAALLGTSLAGGGSGGAGAPASTR